MSDEEEQQYTDEEEEYEAEQIGTTTATKQQQQPKAEEEEEEEEEEEHAAPPVETVSPVLQQALEAKEETKKELRRAPPPKPKEPGTQEMSEAEQKMLEVKKRHEEEEEAKMRDNDERRRQELHQVETELQQLRERQVQRKAEREQEEAELAAKRREDEERRRKQEEERKARLEEEKWRRDEERRKRQRMLGGLGAGGDEGAEGGFKPKQAAKAGRKGMTAEEQANAKRNYIASINRPADVANMLPNDIKIKIKQLYARIVKLEGDKYDLEKRKQRQEYDVKELADRQKQQARHKAIDEGVDPTELENSNHPPKVRVASKFDRQTDRRDYGARRELFENPLVKPELSIVHGSGRPPSHWGRKEVEELEVLRKNMEPPKYIEEIKAEGEAARPPVPVIPLQLPPDADVPVAAGGNNKSAVNGSGAGDNWRERAAQKEKQLPAPPPKDTKKKVRV